VFLNQNKSLYCRQTQLCLF